MKRTVKTLLAVLLCLTIVAVSGCQSQAARVSQNVSKEADNFNVIRRFAAINARTDKPLIEIVGAFSFELEPSRIIITVEVGDGVYKKHSIGLNDWTLWDVEDISGAEVSKYHYEVNFLPEMLFPVALTDND